MARWLDLIEQGSRRRRGERMAKLTRRQVLQCGAGIVAAVSTGEFLLPSSARASQPAAGPTPFPPPETNAIRIACFGCDAPIMAAERYLRQEGFTDIEITGETSPPEFEAALVSGKVHMGPMDPPQFVSSVQRGQGIVGLGSLHPGCLEIWAQAGIGSLTDLRGRTIVVGSKAINDPPYSYIALVLKYAGVDPQEVNFVAQSGVNPINLYLGGKNDAVRVGAERAPALKANPANKGHMVHSQLMDDPWSKLACCILVTTQDWYRANPVAAKRAIRAIFRAADFQPDDRADAVMPLTDRGFFGGPSNFNNVLAAADMVPANWRDLDTEKTVRFYGKLLADVRLLTKSVDEVARALDLRILGELRTELKKY